MKLEAARASDEDDIRALTGYLDIESAEEAMKLHARLFPESTPQTRAMRLLQRVLEDAGTGTGQGPNC